MAKKLLTENWRNQYLLCVAEGRMTKAVARSLMMCQKNYDVLRKEHKEDENCLRFI